MITPGLRSELKKALSGKVFFEENIAPHTTFSIGGKAGVWAKPTSLKEVAWLVRFCRRQKLPLVVIGGGSNILVKERGIAGVVMSLAGGYFGGISVREEEVLAGAAVSLARLLKVASLHNLEGCEFLAGIPGTVGGALAMNAGIKEAAIAGLVREVEVMDFQGERRRLKKNEIDFGYRASSLSRYLILRGRLGLRKGRSREIERRLCYYRSRRLDSLDLEYPSAGCIFKNPAHSSLSSAALIEKCGLKGKRWGDAKISERHANFIVNLGKAKAGDVLRLMSLVQRKVKRTYGVSLIPEIKIIG